MGTEVFVGWRGHGKTMLGVERCRELAARRHTPIIANIKVVPPEGCEFVQIGYDEDGRLDVLGLAVAVLAFRERELGCVILLDEAGLMFSSREWMEFPPGLAMLCAQGRKLRVDLVLTTQFIDQLDKNLRELSEVAHKVRAWPSPSIAGRETGRRPLVMMVSSFRPKNVEAGEAEKRLGRRWVRYSRRREAWYDTDELVMPPSAILAGMSRRRRRRVAERVDPTAVVKVLATS